MITKDLVKLWGHVDFKSLGYKENKHGFVTFVGPQGSGKSVSMLNTALAILKNDASKDIFYTNIDVADERFIKLDEKELRKKLKNGSTRNCGFLLDEAHLYFYTAGRNAQEDLAPFSQLRKRNIIVLGTSQVWFHLDKKIRDQAMYLVVARSTWFGLIFKNTWVRPQDYEITDEGFLEIKRVSFTTRFFRQSYLFDLYNSYETIKL